VGWRRAGFYSYDLLDNLGRPSARQIMPQFQHLTTGDWVEPDSEGRARLITRLRSRCAWAKPTIVTELILMEMGDPLMMRKCLLGIKQRAERLAAGPRLQT
jgi:hypothetical protein